MRIRLVQVGLDVVAKTCELKKRHRAPQDQQAEEEEAQAGQEEEEEEQVQGEPQEELGESLKWAVWKLVRDYIKQKPTRTLTSVNISSLTT